jgi:hypothetical protein
MKRLLTGVLFAMLAGAVVWPHAEESALVQAMQDELARSMTGLAMKDQPAPYYIAYTIEDIDAAQIGATLGARVLDIGRRSRLLRVDVRVGGYAFDSSRFLSYENEAGVMSGYSATAGMACPLDDDYDAVRRQIWLMTDAAYKRAVSVFSKKRAAFQNRAENEPVPDFSRETPVVTILPSAVPAGLPAAWRDGLPRISAVFLGYPDVASSRALLEVTDGTRYFLNSEGFKTITPVRSATLVVEAETRADDGMRLRDFMTAVEQRVEDLPPIEELLERTRAFAADLVALRAAPAAEDYNGPVLVEGQASAELIAQTLVPLFLSQRAPESDTPRGDLMARSTSPFLTRIGSRVMPDPFTVADTPSLATHAGRPVPGAYVVDDEGIRAGDVTLVKDGKLMTLLTGRTPQKRLLTSNGHGRGGSAQAGVFQVQSARGVPNAALKDKYLELLKQQDRPFGFIVRSVLSPWAMQNADIEPDDFMAMAELMQGHGAGTTGPRIVRVVRVAQDGREETVRGLTFGEVPRSAFKDILEASEQQRLYSYRASPSVPGSMFGYYPGGAAEVTVSLLVPDLLFDELDLQRGHDVPQKPPIVASPLRR